VTAGPALLAAVALAAGGPPMAAAAAADLERLHQDLLDELQPVVLRYCDLKRFGSANDGGYLLCDNLSEGIESAYSYGVGPNDDFGCQVSTRYGVPVHQYDCFDPSRPACPEGVFVFHDECIGAASDLDGRPVFDTLASQIARNGDLGKRLLVKIDVEGAEWEALWATPDGVFAQIDQLPMELHGVDDPLSLDVIRKLKRHFHLVNLHFNNHACSAATAPLPAWAFQALWVNKRLTLVDPSAPVPAPHSALNAPDAVGVPDCQLAPAGEEPASPRRHRRRARRIE
jgi:hypothetical protein